MKTITFFDDWLLHRRDGLERVWHRPIFVKEVFSDFYPGFYGYSGFLTVFHDSRVGRYVMYVSIYPPEQDPAAFVVRLESDDPCNWPNPRYDRSVSPAWKSFQNVVTDQHGERFNAYAVQPLAHTPLAERGYVTAEPVAASRSSVLGFSADGMHFNVDREHPWQHPGADQAGNFLWSDKAGVYVIYTRRVWGERRIAYSTTTDFQHFSPLLTSIQPDALDPLGTELYDLPARHYEDLYLGFLHVMSTDPAEKRRVKMVGRVETQLAHSYNGIHWVRPVREPFLGVREYGLQGGGAIYGMEMLRTPDNRLLFYAEGDFGEHGVDPDLHGTYPAGYSSTLLYELRLDGFCSLKTRSRDGVLETKTLIPQAGSIRLNVRTTRHTSVRVQMLDGESLKPLAGYTFEDAVPISGDHLMAPVRWKQRDDLSAWVGKPVRLELQMREAELFAIRLDYKSDYAERNTPIGSLA